MLCRSYSIINLHPAKPGGPKGTWQEIIRQLMENKERESGVTMHLVTPELDAGPPIAYCTFPIRTPHRIDDLWRTWELFHEEGTKERLFNRLREEGLKREFPLIVETLKLLAQGKIKIKDGKVLSKNGRTLRKGRNLTKVVEKKIRARH